MMLMLLSPAKKLDLRGEISCQEHSQPQFIDRAKRLLEILRRYDVSGLMGLMNISEQLARLNRQRYIDFQFPLTPENSRQAAFSFDGDVYLGLEIHSFTAAELQRLQQRLRILSGLFGLLKPLDLIQPYRLEMGTKLPTPLGNTLYDFWGTLLADSLVNELNKRRALLVNLASDEYAEAAKIPYALRRASRLRVIQPIFKDYKNGEYKTNSFFAKKARGMMARYLIRNDVQHADDILGFDIDGYSYSSKHSRPEQPVFLRKLSAAA